MKALTLSLLGGLALVGVVATASGAGEPAPPATTPIATTPIATTPIATTPPATTPIATTPACAVAGPAFGDRGAPLRTALPAKQTLIALDRKERSALPDRLPRAITKHLEAEGARLTSIDSEGWIGIKSMWRRDRRAKGRLHVTGIRLDAAEGRFHAVIDRQYGGKRYSSFVPATLNFNATGCWQVTGKAGKARVTYTVLVRRPTPGEFAPYLP